MAEMQHDPSLQRQLEVYILEAGGQEKAARRIGYSAGTLSQYRKGIYSGDVPKLEAKLKEIFEVKEAAEGYQQSMADYMPTSISENIYLTIRLCHLKGMLAVECGDAGIGKTKAAKKYLRDYPGSTVYFRVNPCNSSVKAFLKALCTKLHLAISSRDDMCQSLYDYFNREKNVLIIDEAQHLPLKTLETIRDWLDEDNPLLGVVLIGNQDILSKRNGVNKACYLQLNNRTRFTNIRHTSHVSLEDVRLLFPALAGHTKELQLLHVIAQSEQGIRGAMNLWSNATDNGNTTYEGLLAMAKSMKILQGGF